MTFAEWWTNNYLTLNHRDIHRATELAYKSATAQQSERIAELEAICSTAYQVVGVLLSDANRFYSKEGEKVLNMLSNLKADDEVLPFLSSSQVELVAEMVEGKVRANLKIRNDNPLRPRSPPPAPTQKVSDVKNTERNNMSLSDDEIIGLMYESGGSSETMQSGEVVTGLFSKSAVIEFARLILKATFEDYCKQFEPIYQISFGGVWHKFDKEYYDQCKFGSKRIVYLAPQQIPSEGEIIDKLTKIIEGYSLAEKLARLTMANPVTHSVNVMKAIAISFRELASKPDCLKD